MQAGEGQLTLGLHTCCCEDLEIGCLLDRDFQERRLAYPGLPAEDQHPCVTSPCILQRGRDPSLLDVPPDQHARIVGPPIVQWTTQSGNASGPRSASSEACPCGSSGGSQVNG